MDKPRPIELLAPARNADIAIEAIKHGADAVYIGPPSNGARAAASNRLEDIARAVEYAHLFNARVYATVNTIIYNNELKEVEKMIKNLYRIGVDALIVQDMAVLKLDIPPIALHASTQCDTRTPEKARFLEAAGFSQIVPARELTVEETAAICSAVDVPVEVFVHGALCVSYSGACYSSFATTGRSANRGECAQICRLPYTLYDSAGNPLLRDKHLLSLRDLNRIADLDELLAAGVSSFKIEGRLKDSAYVKNVVTAYRQALDAIIEAHSDLYIRSSSGASRYSFTPDLNKSFNRGYTSYFTHTPTPGGTMASFASPKWTGEKIGTVSKCAAGAVVLHTDRKLNNGDGLGYFNDEGKFCGFRVNRAEGTKVFPASQINLKPGTVIFRNNDKSWNDIIDRPTATRSININMTLRATASSIIIDIEDEDGNTLTVSAPAELAPADKPQEARQNDILSKTGGTIYTVGSISNHASHLFIPSSTLTSLRRNALEKLDALRRTNHKFTYRVEAKPELSELLSSKKLTFNDNVANSLAREFYSELGAKSIPEALECTRGKIANGTTLMTTRYCIRRECGKCLRTPQGAQWKGPLTLKSGNYTFKLDFDCANCRMHVDYLA
ncbi:MAG: U32 family peptidase [Paramuribaculum sp.]|nr:U32 family peptidase [Paramuribaculum sp.]